MWVKAGISILLALSLYNLFSTLSRLVAFRSLADKKTFTYVHNDFPELLPLNRPITKVDMVLEDSVHYPISGPGAKEQWLSIYPDGFGFVRLGEERRILCVSMFHQLHCMEKMRIALDNPDDPVATIPHLQHCMNYIRQMVLCASDLTLEPVTFDPVTNSSSATGVGVTHTCRDWTAVYETVNDNYARWMEYWETVKDTVPNE